MAEHFPGGVLVFDAVNAMGLKGVNAEVRLAGNGTKSFFSLENPEEELKNWSHRIAAVAEQDYIDGYLKTGYRKTAVSRLFAWVMRIFHMCFMLRVEFREEAP